MEKSEARMIVRRVAMFGDIVISKGHPTKRRAERKFTMQDALRIIGAGAMIGDVKEHEEGFECVMEGPLDDGRMLRIPIIVNPDKNCIIVKSFVRR
jgi:hypothetical protein